MSTLSLVVPFPKSATACAGAILLCTASFSATQSPRIPQPAVPLQPLAQQARRVDTALSCLGQPLGADDRRALDAAISLPHEEEAVQQLQTTLDKYALAIVRINPESRVSVEPGPAAVGFGSWEFGDASIATSRRNGYG